MKIFCGKSVFGGVAAGTIRLYNKEVGESNAAIFEIHQMMLQDDDYNESVENIIRTQNVNSEYAVAVTEDNFAQMFASMDDEYMKARAADVKDISERVLTILSGGGNDNMSAKQECIIIADSELDGKMAVVDGNDGRIYIEPDDVTLKELMERKKADDEYRKLLQQLKGRDNVTLDGKHIRLYANIGNIKDLATVIQNDAE